MWWNLRRRGRLLVQMDAWALPPYLLIHSTQGALVQTIDFIIGLKGSPDPIFSFEVLPFPGSNV